MTQYRCWVEFPTDKSLQLRVKKGEFGESCPIGYFPSPPGNNSWPGILNSWCKERQLTPVYDDLELRIKVKKAQIEDFIEYVYGSSPSYFDPSQMLTWKGHAYLANQLNDLRAFVAQQLNPRLWYELKADEF